MNSFYSDFVSGTFDNFIKGTEENKVVMDKTVSVSTDPSDSKIKIDNLDSDNTLEKDILKQRKAERDVTGTVPLPLFRFEEKERHEIESVIEQFVEIATDLLKENDGSVYTPLFGYVNVFKKSEIKYLMDLTISRNKEIFNTSAKEFEIEMITCYIDKKLRVKFNLSEDHLIDESVDVEYTERRKVIYDALIKLLNNIMDKMTLKKTGTEKDIDIYLKESSGDENHGTGYSIFLKYNKLIDYSNYRRGKEGYEDIIGLLDEDFAKSLENSDLIEEQNSINKFERSTEAISDGMTEKSDDSNTDESEGDPDNEEESDSDESGDMMEDGDSMDEDSEDNSMESDEESTSDDSSDSSSSGAEKQQVAGQNPFADINSREKLSIELNVLKDQIDKVLIKLGQFKSNVVVKKLIELYSNVEDALKNSYIVPLQDSLIRYSLYVTQFDNLISALEKYFESKSNSKY